MLVRIDTTKEREETMDKFTDIDSVFSKLCGVLDTVYKPLALEVQTALEREDYEEAQRCVVRVQAAKGLAVSTRCLYENWRTLLGLDSTNGQAKAYVEVHRELTQPTAPVPVPTVEKKRHYNKWGLSFNDYRETLLVCLYEAGRPTDSKEITSSMASKLGDRANHDMDTFPNPIQPTRSAFSKRASDAISRLNMEGLARFSTGLNVGKPGKSSNWELTLAGRDYVEKHLLKKSATKEIAVKEVQTQTQNKGGGKPFSKEITDPLYRSTLLLALYELATDTEKSEVDKRIATLLGESARYDLSTYGNGNNKNRTIFSQRTSTAMSALAKAGLTHFSLMIGGHNGRKSIWGITPAGIEYVEQTLLEQETKPQ